jgi:NAD(P)H-flavin reductase/hemoglobin-like flavoprotein
MAMPPEPVLIKESFARVEHVADKVAAHFYARLFTEHPELRDMFPLMMDGPRARLLRALVRIVAGWDTPVQLDQYLGRLGHDHRKFGVRPEHYPAVGRALMIAIREFTPDGAWTAEVEAAWMNAYGAMAARMITGAAESAGAPAWWNARVVRVERAAREIALLTLRPDQPYPYRAGQYVTVETPRRPRLWRPYSVANAPRRDGSLELHVKALSGGWVSNALVAHTRVGDVLRLGPAQGSLPVDPGAGPDLLLVGGGTGIAPLKAMVEDLAGWNVSRSVQVFVGARRLDELYALSPLLRLSERYPWLTVAGVVSDDPAYPGRRGLVCDVAASAGDWSGRQVRVSGSPAMIRATVAALRARQVPLERIGWDPYDEL